MKRPIPAADILALLSSAACLHAPENAATAPSTPAAHYGALADVPFEEGFIPKQDIAGLQDELTFQSAVQLNM